MRYELSLKVVHAFLDPETPKALSVPLAALIAGALSQAEATIELTNRVFDSVFHPINQDATDSAVGSPAAPAMSQD